MATAPAHDQRRLLDLQALDTRLDQIAHQRAQLFIKVGDFLRGGAQHRVPKQADGLDRHSGACPFTVSLADYARQQ